MKKEGERRRRRRSEKREKIRGERRRKRREEKDEGRVITTNRWVQWDQVDDKKQYLHNPIAFASKNRSFLQ
jgi:hypothetical protein